MLRFIEHVTVLCFAASYGVAFALELWHLFRPRPILRIIAFGFGVAGLLAHAIFVIWQYGFAVPGLQLGSPTGSLYFLSFVLAVFCLYGSLHHRQIAWSLFVLPLILGLIGLGKLKEGEDTTKETMASWHLFWGYTHAALVILAAVGVCVGFIASIMYLVQLRRLQAKLPQGHGMPMLNLERLEQMNRRAILWAFPLLTAGILAGFVLQYQLGLFRQGFEDIRILSVLGSWLVFTILLYLRYRVHVRGRQLALWTMLAFTILVVALLTSHDFAQGGAR